MIWVNLATTVRRLHDRNWSGWWAVAVFAVNRLSYLYYGLFLGLSFGVDISVAEELLLVMIAVALGVLQTWIIIELLFLAGTDGPNRFGPDPTRATPQSLIGPRAEPAGPISWCPALQIRRASVSLVQKSASLSPRVRHAYF